MKKIILLIVIILIAIVVVSDRNDQDAVLEDSVEITEEEVVETQGFQEEQDVQQQVEPADEVSGYEIDTTESVIAWTGSKPVYSREGTINLSEGSLNEDLTGTLVFDMNSIDSTTEGLVGHLKSEDFFDVAQYPEAQLVINSVEEGVLSGDLTIKDTIQSFQAPVTVTETEEGITITSGVSIDRTQYGIVYGSGSFFDNLGDAVINDMIDLEVTVVASSSNE